ncbi:MAG: FixG Ig-like domain-containing protein, partial [Erythrobacter sp.]
APDAFGDCIDCLQCVAVCPTGIDIREGPQIGCITCALCIDACDRVMRDVGRPRGLIDYATLEDCKAEQAGAPPRPAWQALLRPRTLAYFAVWGGIGLGLLFALGVRNHTDLTVSPDRNPPFMLLKDGSVRNAYTLKLRNMESRPRRMEIALRSLPGALLWTDTIAQADAARSHVVEVAADETRTVRAYVAAPPGATQQDFAFVLTSQDEQAERDVAETLFNAPGGQ